MTATITYLLAFAALIGWMELAAEEGNAMNRNYFDLSPVERDRLADDPCTADSDDDFDEDMRDDEDDYDDDDT